MIETARDVERALGHLARLVEASELGE